jgi:hypothetical protein
MVSVVRSGRCCVVLAQQPDTLHHTLHLSSRRCVGCIRSPESLTDVSSSGFTYLPPSCDSKSIGYRNCGYLSSRRCVGCICSPESLTSVSSSGFTYLPPSCDSKAIGYRNCEHLSSRRCVGCICSPESLTDVSSSGFTYLPPSCDSKSIGYRNRRYRSCGNGSLDGNHVRARFAILQLSNILHSSSRNTCQCLFGQKCLMTSKQDVMA